MRRGLIALLLLATACTGSSGGGSAEPTGPPDPCAVPDAPTIPATCIPGESGSFQARPSESGSPPISSAAIPPVLQPPEQGELARGGNDQDSSITTRSFIVTLPAGQRLRTTLACQGAHDVSLTTTPSSKAEQSFACGYTEVALLTVEDPVPAKAPTRYVVKVVAPAPARWYAVVSGTASPVTSG